ncbi:MAG: type II toxin-antitoxin system HicB family antitoxin [Desulfovibrio sp.]
MQQERHALPLEIRFRPDGEQWLGEAPEIGVMTQGRTLEEAQENLKDALRLFIESCLRRGVLDQILAEAGFSKRRVEEVRSVATSLPMSDQCGCKVCRV